MVLREHGSTENIQSPSTYRATVQDVDNDSYTSAVTGELIDNPIAVGMLNVAMSWDMNSEEEAEELMQKTYKNPWYLDLKVPVVKGGLLENAPFRVSKRDTEMITTGKGTDNEKTIWRTSFNIMQKALTEAQINAVEEANS